MNLSHLGSVIVSWNTWTFLCLASTRNTAFAVGKQTRDHFCNSRTPELSYATKTWKGKRRKEGKFKIYIFLNKQGIVLLSSESSKKFAFLVEQRVTQPSVPNQRSQLSTFKR